MRRLARELADVAAKALTVSGRPVRRPRADRLAEQIIQRAGKAPDLVSLVREISGASLALSHPRYSAQQVAAPVPAAALVESVVAAMNQSLAVWEMSPIATAVDRDLMAGFKKLFGYPQAAEGSLVPGGAFANLTALLAARDALAPQASKSGQARIAIIVGAQAHYSIARAAAILGLGRNAVFKVPLDAEFCTDVEQPESLLCFGPEIRFPEVHSGGLGRVDTYRQLRQPRGPGRGRAQAPRVVSRRCGAWGRSRLQPPFPLEAERPQPDGLDHL